MEGTDYKHTNTFIFISGMDNSRKKTRENWGTILIGHRRRSELHLDKD